MKYYIYFHKDPRTNEVKYIGKGTGRRYKEMGKRKRSLKHLNWTKSLNKLNLYPICEIVEYFEKENDAYAKEKELIALYRDQGVDLKNHADGGQGGMSGSLNPNYGKKNLPMVQATRRSVVCITTGEKFESLTKAAEKYNLSIPHISDVCKLKRKHVGNFIFRYEGEESLIFYRKKRTIKNRHMPKHRKSIVLIELNIVFDKIMDAVRYCQKNGNPTDRCAIRRVAQGKYKSAGGYTWRFV
jgi:hypothetical protein